MPGSVLEKHGISVRRLALLGGVALALALPGAPASAQAMVATGVGTPFELAFWQSIDSSSDASLYEAYLTRFPNGTFSEIARAKIVALRARTAQAQPALTVPVAAPAPVASALPPPPPPPPPPASPPLSYAPVAQQTTVAPEPAAAAPAGASPGTMGQLLAALATSQASATPVPTPAAIAAPAARQGFALPAQPTLSPVPQVALPASFCSAEARNAFHAAVYMPAVSQAKANNDAATAYMHQLQSLYDEHQLSHDPDTMNAIVGAARTYQQVAQTTFSMQAALVRQFGALMAVPVVACSQPMQPPVQTLAK